MLELSYWLFPIIVLFFVVVPPSSAYLLPGLFSACVAGSANSIVAGKYGYAWGHAIAAFLLASLAWYRGVRNRTDEWPREAALISSLGWVLAAFIVISIIPDKSWPYVLSKKQMVHLFVMFLPVGFTLTRLAYVQQRTIPF